MTKSLIFDFDGTLVDSEKGINECFKKITKKLAPERIDFTQNILIGPPLRETASKILGTEDQDSLDKFVQLFIKMHDKKVIEHTQPFPDVVNTLQFFHSKNVQMALATNKRWAPTKKLIDHFNWHDYFTIIECSDSKKKLRSKEEIIKEIILEDTVFEESFFIGDTINDGLSANQNQLEFVKANYGYGQKENWDNVKIKFEINSFDDLKKIINI